MELTRKSTKLQLNASMQFGVIVASDHFLYPRHNQRLIPLTNGIIKDMEELRETDNPQEIIELIAVDNPKKVNVPIETPIMDMMSSDSFDLTGLIRGRVHQELKRQSRLHERVPRFKMQNIILEFLYNKRDNFSERKNCDYSSSNETLTSSLLTITCSELSFNSQSSASSTTSSLIREDELFVEQLEKLDRRLEKLDKDVGELKVILEMNSSCSKKSIILTSAVQEQDKKFNQEVEPELEIEEPIEEKFASVFFE